MDKKPENEKAPLEKKNFLIQDLQEMDFTIYLEEDGRVVISDLPPDLLDLVKELDPEAEIFCSLDNPAKKEC